jgi:transcription antitermination factor NusA-like protein
MLNNIVLSEFENKRINVIIYNSSLVEISSENLIHSRSLNVNILDENLEEDTISTQENVFVTKAAPNVVNVIKR